MNIIKKLFFLTLFLNFSSCANYINQMHKEFDRVDDVREPPRQSRNDQFNMYRKHQNGRIKRKVNSINNPYVAPATKRQYTSSTNIRKRYKANDLIDHQNGGSLWGSPAQSNDNYLFTSNNHKSNGDIILIKVEEEMKKEITAELKRAFPSPTMAPHLKKNPKATQAAGPTPASNGDEENEKAEVVYDRISSVVVEEINKDHLLLRGRKNVLYKNRKRVVEIQALISRRDIASDDTLLSNRIIENNISVIR